MPMPNLPPEFDLGKRLSGIEQRLQAVETKQFPVNFDSVWNFAETFAVPTSATTVVSAQLTVPAGFTTALIMGTAELYMACQPATGTSDYAYGQISIDSSDGHHSHTGSSALWGTATGSGSWSTPVPTVGQFPSVAAVFPDLAAGTTITVSAQAWSGQGWSASNQNLAEVHALVLYLL